MDTPADTYTDPRDGTAYKTVNIGTQTWLAENLAFKASGGCWAYGNNQSNVAKYGYLYDWETANNVCPSGWRLPSYEEWRTLIDFLGGAEVAGPKMRSSHGWPDDNGTNESGFEGLPGGCFGNLRSFEMIDLLGYWWSSTKKHGGSCWGLLLWPNDNKVYWNSIGPNNLFMGFSVRCLRAGQDVLFTEDAGPRVVDECERSESEAVEALLSIYAKNPDGFAQDYGDPRARAKVREIGETLNGVGGMELMLKVHAEFQRRTRVFGAPRNLEHTWDRIGEWQG